MNPNRRRATTDQTLLAMEGPLSKVHDSFEIMDARFLRDVSGEATRLRHVATGAEVLAVRNGDPELVFGIFLETRPVQSNGVAHLLEHLVFRGSQRYPATHLYSALVQGTLLTGLNASTRADSTLFHLSSGQAADFSNLIDILLDAVFHPLLRHEDILEEREVVKNEMTGHQAVAQQQILENLRQALLPETVYALDYGGAPTLLAKLSPEELRRFHATQYHPGTARLFLWGDTDLIGHLDQIDRFLGSGPQTSPKPSGFSRSLPAAGIRDIVFATPDESSWLTGLGWAFDLQDADLWRALSFALVAKPGGMITQALSETKTRLLGPGFTADTPLGTFEIALAGQTPETQDTALAAVQRALEKLGKDGIAPVRARQAIDQLELNLRGYGRPGPGAQGLRALNLIRDRWRHGSDPLAELDISARLAHLRAALAENPAALQQLAERDLLDNPHKCTVSLKAPAVSPPRPPRHKSVGPVPDPTVRGDDLALPKVGRSDLPLRISKTVQTLNKGILHVPVPGPGLCRAEIAVSMGGLDGDQFALVPFFVSLLKQAETQVAVEISAKVRTLSTRAGKDTIWLCLSGRSLPTLAENLLRQMRDALCFGVVPADQIKGQVTAEIAGLTSRIALAGHDYCETRLRALGSQSAAWNEHLNGISQKTLLSDLLARDPAELSAALARLGKRLAGETRVHLAVSGMDPCVAERIFPGCGQPGEATPDLPLLDLSKKEGLSTAASNFTVGQALPVRDPGAAQVIARLLETGWLWQSVRVAGGAYSARCRFGMGDRLLTFLSIRDPNAMATLDRFAQSPLWLEHNAKGDLLERCIAATVAQLAAAPRPDDSVAVALYRHLCSETDDQRQADLDAIRAVTPASIREAAEEMAAHLAEARTVILGPQNQLQSVLATRPEAFDLRLP